MFRYLLLGLLRDGKPQHGYALMKSCRARSGVETSTGNIYRELQRLVGEGLVRVCQNPPGADPRRTPYEITAAGREAFDLWLGERPGPESLTDCCDDEISVRAMFLGEVDVAIANEVLDGWKDALWISCREVEHVRRSALRDADEDLAVLPILLARRLRHLAADVDLVEELRTAYLANATARAQRAPKLQPAEREPSPPRTKRARSVRPADGHAAAAPPPPTAPRARRDGGW